MYQNNVVPLFHYVQRAWSIHIIHSRPIVKNIGIRQIRFTEIKERNFPRLIRAYIGIVYTYVIYTLK